MWAGSKTQGTVIFVSMKKQQEQSDFRTVVLGG